MLEQVSSWVRENNSKQINLEFSEVKIKKITKKRNNDEQKDWKQCNSVKEQPEISINLQLVQNLISQNDL